MAPPLADSIAEQVEQASKLYHRLVIVAGPPRSGKTGALRDLHQQRGWPLVNINLALSERLLELSVKQRAIVESEHAARMVASYSAWEASLCGVEPQPAAAPGHDAAGDTGGRLVPGPGETWSNRAVGKVAWIGGQFVNTGAREIRAGDMVALSPEPPKQIGGDE